MSTQATKIQTLEFALDTKPGALSQVYNAFREANVNIIGSWAYEKGPGDAKGIIYAENTTQAKDVLTKMGKNPKTANACYVTGTDKVGPYADCLQKIAAAHVNLHATDAIGVGGKFATVFFAEEKDIPTLCKALGC